MYNCRDSRRLCEIPSISSKTNQTEIFDDGIRGLAYKIRLFSGAIRIWLRGRRLHLRCRSWGCGGVM